MYDICPSCKSENYLVMDVDSSNGYAGLHIYRIGGLKLNVCKDCGTVYVSKRYLERIKEVKND